MQSVYDWITIALFGGLIVLFLERSSVPEPQDRLSQYLLPATGCAVADYAGNNGQSLIAIAIIAGVLFYTHLVLKPLDMWRRR